MRRSTAVMTLAILVGFVAFLERKTPFSLPLDWAGSLAEMVPLVGNWPPAPKAPEPMSKPEVAKPALSERGGSASTVAKMESDTLQAAKVLEGAPQPGKPEDAKGVEAVIEIARISPDGPSVLAGTAAPHSQVTVLEDAKPVATAKADANGDWSIVTEHRFASPDPQINLRSGPEAPDVQIAAKGPVGNPSRADRVPEPEVAVSRKAGEAPAPISQENPTARLMKEFEDVVAAAREDAKKEPKPDTKEQDQAASPEKMEPAAEVRAPVVPSSSEASGTKERATDSATAPDPATGSLPEPPQPAPEAKPQHMADAGAAPPASPETNTAPPRATSVIPVPMTFVYKETTLTADGRRAALLLLEYLTLKRFNAVTLSGHADERGSPDNNMELSRERLDAIVQFLRDGGYKGEIDRLPKGESEPYGGIDRTRHLRDDLMQLDRRVELRVAQ